MHPNRPIKLSCYLALVFLVACTATGSREWPESIPHQQLFVDKWLGDGENQLLQEQEEYLNWVRVFYTGNLIYPDGWLDIQSQLLKASGAERQIRLATELEQLGIAIAAEWAKSNDRRLVDSRMLALWGSILQMAQLEQTEMQAIELIARDIEQLLAGNLAKEQIVEARYADRLGLETFGVF